MKLLYVDLCYPISTSRKVMQQRCQAHGFTKKLDRNRPFCTKKFVSLQCLGIQEFPNLA